MEAQRDSLGALAGEPVLQSFFYSRSLLLLSWIPCAVGVAFGAELAFLRLIFPRQGLRLLVYFGWLVLAAGLLGFVLSTTALIRRKPFLILNRTGILANVLLGKGYLWIPWEVILDVQKTVRRTAPPDTDESPLMREASQESLLALKLAPSFSLPRFMLQAADLGEGWLGLQIGMLEGSKEAVVEAVRKAWFDCRGGSPDAGGRPSADPSWTPGP